MRPMPMAAMLAIVALSGATLMLADNPAEAGEVLPCALSGSRTVMIGGKPALRLSDVENCPMALVEIVPGIEIDGQPLVHLKTGADADAACAATGEASVLANGKPMQGVGHVACMNAAGLSQ